MKKYKVHKTKKLSKKRRKKLSKLYEGRKLPKTTKEKLSKSHKGKIPWNKGKEIKGYLAEMLVLESNTTAGKIYFDRGDLLGVMYVFKTKKAAQEMFGKNVSLIKIETNLFQL